MVQGMVLVLVQETVLLVVETVVEEPYK
jgi:hypothetical protein